MTNQAVQDAIIDAAVAEIQERKGEPGLKVFLTGDSEVDGAMAEPATMTSTSADRVVIYHRETGEPREVLVNMLSKTLRKKMPDGMPAFSVTPTVDYKLGQFKCWLHPEHPDREVWDAEGLAGVICESGHLASEFHVRRHMENKHSDESKAITEIRDRKERDENRRMQIETQRAMLALATAQAEKKA